MKYKLADDARPQVKLLLAATAATIVLWFIPYAEYLVYPIRFLSRSFMKAATRLLPSSPAARCRA